MNPDIVNLESNLNGEGLRIGVVMARFNLPVCEGLRDAFDPRQQTKME